MKRASLGLLLTLPLWALALSCEDEKGPSRHCLTDNCECSDNDCACPSSGDCAISCPTICDLECSGSGHCDLECGEGCDTKCTGSASCDVSVGANSVVECTGAGSCDITCRGDCTADCSGPGSCSVRCAPGANCNITDCRGDLQACGEDENGNEVTSCGFSCP